MLVSNSCSNSNLRAIVDIVRVEKAPQTGIGSSYIPISYFIQVLFCIQISAYCVTLLHLQFIYRRLQLPRSHAVTGARIASWWPWSGTPKALGIHDSTPRTRTTTAVEPQHACTVDADDGCTLGATTALALTIAGRWRSNLPDLCRIKERRRPTHARREFHREIHGLCKPHRTLSLSRWQPADLSKDKLDAGQTLCFVSFRALTSSPLFDVTIDRRAGHMSGCHSLGVCYGWWSTFVAGA